MSSNPSDPQLVTRLLALTKGLTGREVAEAVGVTEANVSKWRNGKVPTYLHAPTRARIEAILAQPGWKYVPSAPPSPEAERAASEQAAYAAGVLWGLAAQAEDMARRAREAHTRLTERPKGRSIAAVTAQSRAMESTVAASQQAAEQVAARKAAARRGRPKRTG